MSEYKKPGAVLTGALFVPAPIPERGKKMSEWSEKWAYRFGPVREAFGYEYVRDSVRSKEGNLRLFLGRYPDGFYTVITARLNSAGEVRGLPVVPGEKIEESPRLPSGEAYKLYLELRDSLGLKPKTPRGGYAIKARKTGIREAVKREAPEPGYLTDTEALEIIGLIENSL